MNERDGLTRSVGQMLKGLRESGAPLFYTKIAGGFFQRRGLPDYVLCVRGRFVAVELKHPTRDEKQSPSQNYVMRWIRSAGGEYKVCRSRKEVLEFVTGMLQV